jgi:hypothetical protein
MPNAFRAKDSSQRDECYLLVANYFCSPLFTDPAEAIRSHLAEHRDGGVRLLADRLPCRDRVRF